MKILRLDKTGLPRAWLTAEEAATLLAKSAILWTLGSDIYVLRGGWNRNGEQSRLVLPAIIACKGDTAGQPETIPMGNRLLFRRDNYRCLYCGEQFAENELTRDHVIPRVQGGKDVWTNVVAACKRCNHGKGGRTPEQAGMDLLAVPFVPNWFEYMYLANRKILGDQMDYLSARFSSKRIWQAA